MPTSKRPLRTTGNWSGIKWVCHLNYLNKSQDQNAGQEIVFPKRMSEAGGNSAMHILQMIQNKTKWVRINRLSLYRTMMEQVELSEEAYEP